VHSNNIQTGDRIVQVGSAELIGHEAGNGRHSQGEPTVDSGDLGRPVRFDVGHAFQGKPAEAKRRWPFDLFSHTGGAVKPARVFRSDPPVSVS
jgi:hypothetical protein